MAVLKFCLLADLLNGFLFDLLANRMECCIHCVRVCFVFNPIFAELP